MKVFLHIGLGRSGSDFLQKKIFSNLLNVNYFDRYNSKKFDKFRINLFYNPFFNLKKKEKFEIKSNSIISTENFFNSDYKLNELIIKIKEVYKKPQIILILREPFSHLISLYKYSVQNGLLWRSLDETFDFEKTRRARNVSNNIIFYKNFYNYKLLIRFLKKNFTKVEIFKFEKIFSSYEEMKKFVSFTEKKFGFKYKSRFLKKDFYKINPSSNNFIIQKKRIFNFKKDNNNFFLKEINKLYFKNFYSLKFKKKFINSLEFDYEKLF